jgi:hypothetical protein
MVFCRRDTTNSLDSLRLKGVPLLAFGVFFVHSQYCWDVVKWERIGNMISHNFHWFSAHKNSFNCLEPTAALATAGINARV